MPKVDWRTHTTNPKELTSVGQMGNNYKKSVIDFDENEAIQNYI